MTTKAWLDAALSAALRFPESLRHEQEAAARAALTGATLTQVGINRWLAQHPGTFSRRNGKISYTATAESVAAARVSLVAEAMLRTA